ncbi:MAG: alkaline phosphatase [Planctomycetota bacterium]|nr:MAG: alkaline phosphatase [Planctomycetota bacterium]
MQRRAVTGSALRSAASRDSARRPGTRGRSRCAGALWLAVLVAASTALAAPSSPPLRGAILMIGDGMGTSALSLGRLVKGRRLALEAMPVVGLVDPAPVGAAVTDSAAAATALATGRRTRNRLVGLDPAGQRLESHLERLAARGGAVGVVTTARLTHATPAAFYGHVAHRRQERELAAQLLASELQLALGGGAELLEQALAQPEAARDWQLVRTAHELERVERGRVLGLFGPSHLRYAIDRRPGDREPSLAAMVRAALRLLARDPARPFFLVAEGGRIDHAGHSHDAAALAREVLAFDEAVATALGFAQHDGRTLLVVTADHATAGLAVAEDVDLVRLRRARSSAERLLERLEQPGGQDKAAAVQRLGLLVHQELGIALSPRELAWALGTRWRYAPAGGLAHQVSARLGVHFYPLGVQARHEQTEGHQASMVPIFAWGPGAERFSGVLPIDEVGRRLGALLLEAAPPAPGDRSEGRRP